MDRLPRLIRFHNCGFIALLALLVSACASLPDKSSVHKSGHNIQGDEPDLVIQTIRDLVMQLR